VWDSDRLVGRQCATCVPYGQGCPQCADCCCNYDLRVRIPCSGGVCRVN
jgi:hypothetical protein